MSGIMPVPLDTLIAECKKIEKMFTKDIEALERRREIAKGLDNTQLVLSFGEALFAQYNSYHVTLLFHSLLLNLHGSPTKEQLDDVAKRQTELEEFYKTHARGLHWVENLQTHTPSRTDE
jgi:hypothetical protein